MPEFKAFIKRCHSSNVSRSAQLDTASHSPLNYLYVSHTPTKMRLITLTITFLLSSSLALANQGTATSDGHRVISLHDLLVAALNDNLELRAKRLDPEMQQLRVDAAWGAFEPSLVGGASYVSSERARTFQERTSIFAQLFGATDPVTREDIGRFQAGVAGRLPFGTTYEALTGYDEMRTNSNGFNSEFITNSNITVTQPLLKDFGLKAGLAEVRLQERATAAMRQELRAVVLRVMRDVASAYHEMAFAQENVAVKEQAVAVAQDLVRENRRRVEEGRMAPIDVTQAESRLSEAREELLIARNFLAQRRNTLRELTRDHFNDQDLFTVDRAFVSTTAPAIDRTDALSALYNNNPSYLASVEAAKAEDVRLAYAENQRLPRVDLKASYGYNGIGNSLTRSYRNYWERDQPTWSAGVVINVPVWDKTGKARLSEAKKRKEQALLLIQRTEVTLLAALDTAVRDIENSTERVALVKDSVRLADAALSAELRRLSSGMTTSFNVAQAQRDVSTARSRELATYVDLNKAITNLYFILGTLHEELRVNIAD